MLLSNLRQPGWKKRLALAAVLSLTLGMQAAVAQEVRWLTSAEKAANEAEKTGKPILVYVRSSSCHYCDKLQADVWEDPQVAAHVAKNYIPLKLSSQKNPTAVKSLKVKGFPTTLVFSAKRVFVSKVEGYRPRGSFFAEIEKSRSARKLRDAVVR